MATKIIHRNQIKKCLSVIFLTSLFISCSDNENNNVPLVEVYIDIAINDPSYVNLKTVGGWEYINGGSRGLIVYRLDQGTFKSYDRHCTFQPSSTCALVSVDGSNITASDHCCGSSFLLHNGSVTSPPAALPLQEYPTSFDGTIIRIRN